MTVLMSTPDMSAETLEFQAEARQLLQLVVHSIYSNKDIFLRELISNASDALDKLRLAVLQDGLEADISELHIVLEADQEARTLTVRDNGIGMTRDEVVSLIGTIAKSGTAELLRKLKETDADSTELIGQLGVGFYSTFMVADKVTVVSRMAGSPTDGVSWESDGQGSYSHESVEKPTRGTDVILQQKEDAQEYLNEWTVRSLVKTSIGAPLMPE